MSLIDDIFSWFCYIRFLISPLLLGFIVGASLFLFVFKGNNYGWVIGSICVLLGLGYGIYLAEFARRMGTVNFLVKVQKDLHGGLLTGTSPEDLYLKDSASGSKDPTDKVDTSKKYLND